MLTVSSLPFTYSFDRSEMILDKENHPSSTLVNLMSVMDLELSSDLNKIVDITQKNWLRSKIRWREQERFSDYKAQVLPLIDQLGCLDEVLSKKTEYDYVILQGASIGAMQSRLNFLFKEFQRGVCFKKLVVVTGERKLDKEVEHPQFNLKDTSINLDAVETESDAMDVILTQVEFPYDVSRVELIRVKVPKQFQDGKERLPNAKDCLMLWQKIYQPDPGSVLYISSQPYVGYQDSIARSALSDDFEIETIGYRASDKLTISNHLDNIARWLYSEANRRKVY